MKNLITFLLIGASLSTFAQKKDTLRFIIIENNCKIGTAWMLHSAQNEYQNFCKLQDNSTFTKYHVNDEQVITDFVSADVPTHTIIEKYNLLPNGSSEWEIYGQKGESSTNPALFLTGMFTPDNPLTRALLASPTKKIAVLPTAGEASMYLAYELTLKNKQKIFLFQINGLNTRPMFNWVDDNGNTIGKIFENKAIVRTGYEEYTEYLLKIQTMVEAKAMKELAKKQILAKRTHKNYPAKKAPIKSITRSVATSK